MNDIERPWTAEELDQGFRVLHCEPNEDDPKRLDIMIQLLPPLSYIALHADEIRF